MNSDLARRIMQLAKEGFESKKLTNYKAIYQEAASVWMKGWEKELWHTVAEKEKLYRDIKAMKF